MARFTCPDCGGGFPEPAEGNEGAPRCPWCGRGFSTTAGIPSESEAAETATNAAVYCGEPGCRKGFDTLEAYRDHDCGGDPLRDAPRLNWSAAEEGEN